MAGPHFTAFNQFRKSRFDSRYWSCGNLFPVIWEELPVSWWESVKDSKSCGSNFKADIAILIDATQGRPELFKKQINFAKKILSENWFPNIGAETRLKVVPYSLRLSKHVTAFNKSLDQIGHHRYINKVWLWEI